MAGVLVAVVAVATPAMIEAHQDRTTAANSFHHAVCGFGMGASVAPTWSFFSVDPRIEHICENELQPIPGIACPNPAHGATTADLPPLEPPR